MTLGSRTPLALVFCLIAANSGIAERKTESPTAALSPPVLRRAMGTAGEQSVLGSGAAGAFDEHWVACPSLVVKDSLHRMWYSSHYTPGFGGVGIGSARSRDGLH